MLKAQLEVTITQMKNARSESHPAFSARVKKMRNVCSKNVIT